MFLKNCADCTGVEKTAVFLCKMPILFFCNQGQWDGFLRCEHSRTSKKHLPVSLTGYRTTKCRDKTRGICRCICRWKPECVNEIYYFLCRKIFRDRARDMAKPTNFPRARKAARHGFSLPDRRRMPAWLLGACMLLYLHINIWWIFVFSIIFGGKSEIHHGNAPKNTAAVTLPSYLL